MASTFTSSLRIEKPGHGDYFNSWETVANRIFDLVDDAVAGTTKITTTGGPTLLTTANGTADQARRAILLIEGALVGNATITVPNLSKVYALFNGTSGAFSVTILVDGAAGTLVMPQQTAAFIATDGAGNISFVTAPVAPSGAVSIIGLPQFTGGDVTSPSAGSTQLNIGAGRVTGPHLAGGAALANIADNTIPAAKLQTGAAAASLGNAPSSTIYGNVTGAAAARSDVTLAQLAAALVADATARASLAGVPATTATLVDGPSIAWDAGVAKLATVTLAGNRVLANPTNLAAGTYILIVRQDATGSRTLTFGAAFRWPNGTAPTLSTAAGATDIISFVSDGTNLYGVAQKGFA